jgi:hypothetical protein
LRLSLVDPMLVEFAVGLVAVRDADGAFRLGQPVGKPIFRRKLGSLLAISALAHNPKVNDVAHVKLNRTQI